MIEDNHVIAIMVEDHLLEHGYASVEIATSQPEAVEMATARCPDLITVDDKLDIGTGVEAIRGICRDRAIPAVSLTARPNTIRDEMPDAAIVEKPFSYAKLVAGIDAAIHAPTSF